MPLVFRKITKINLIVYSNVCSPRFIEKEKKIFKTSLPSRLLKAENILETRYELQVLFVIQTQIKHFILLSSNLVPIFTIE